MGLCEFFAGAQDMGALRVAKRAALAAGQNRGEVLREYTNALEALLDRAERRLRGALQVMEKHNNAAQAA